MSFLKLQNPKSTSPWREQNTTCWILFNGTKVTIYNGKYGDTTNSIVYFRLNGTSGGIGYQNASYQSVKEKGPIPNGDYSINLELDPTRSVKMSDGQTSANHGIQQMLTKDNAGNLLWGRWRARLEKSTNTTARDNFYFHDSYKGHSHGCIETESPLYYFFYSLHAQDYKSIMIKVDYPSTDTKTSGGTDKTPFKLPTNVKKFWKRYSFLPAGDPKKIPWMPWPIDNQYRFEPEFFELTKYR